MALIITDWSITSDLTPESARYRDTGNGGHWTLSWLPRTALTREQALSGMILDETLSDPGLVHNALAAEVSAAHAATLGVRLDEVLMRLFSRTSADDEHGSGVRSEDPPGPPHLYVLPSGA